MLVYVSYNSLCFKVFEEYHKQITRPQNTRAIPCLTPIIPWDFQIRREINKDRDWYINIYNIFDEEYEVKLFSPAAGRTVIAGVDFKF